MALTQCEVEYIYFFNMQKFGTKRKMDDLYKNHVKVLYLLIIIIRSWKFIFVLVCGGQGI